MKKLFNSVSIKQILLISLIIHIIASLFSAGYHHSDEHYQIIEFLNYKINPAVARDLPWEFSYQARPWFQVFWYYLIYKGLNFFTSPSPFLIIAFVRFLTGMFSFYSFYRFQEVIKKWFPDQLHEKVATILFHFIWFLPYIQSRTSSENFGISFFLLGLIYFYRSSSKNLILSGLFLSFAYLSRTQMALMVASFWFWCLLIHKLNFKHLIYFSSGIVIGILIGPIFDFWGYNAWTFVPWNYYTANFTRGILESSGVQPWHFYFSETWTRSIPPLGIFIFAPMFYFIWKKPSHVLSAIVFPFFIFHCLLGHKELRFLFPLAPFIGIALTMLIFENLQFFERIWTKSLIIRLLGKIALVLNLLLLLWVIFTPANAYHRFYAYIYEHREIKSIHYIGENPYWIGDLKLSFYKPDYLEVKKVSDVAEIQQKDYFLFMNEAQLATTFLKKDKCQLIYSSYPKWMYEKLMFIKGFARTRSWALFNCH